METYTVASRFIDPYNVTVMKSETRLLHDSLNMPLFTLVVS